MGYMTTITILNDAWHIIKENPEEFINNIDNGINGLRRINGKYDRSKYINSYGVGNHCNPMEVAKSNHADDPRLFLTYGNMMVALGYFNDIDNLQLRKDILKIAKGIIKDEEREIKSLEEKLNS